MKPAGRRYDSSLEPGATRPLSQQDADCDAKPLPALKDGVSQTSTRSAEVA